MVQPFDLGEGGLKTIPLGFKLLPTNGLGKWIFENTIVVPKLELFERRTACKELIGPLSIELLACCRIGWVKVLTSSTLPTKVFC